MVKQLDVVFVTWHMRRPEVLFTLKEKCERKCKTNIFIEDGSFALPGGNNIRDTNFQLQPLGDPGCFMEHSNVT